MPNMNDRSGLKFGGNAGQRASGSRQMMLKTFREDETEVRALWENPRQTWVTIWQHYDKKLGSNGLSYPCAFDAGLPTCIGHRTPVANEDAEKEDKKNDPGWQVRKVSQRVVAPFLTRSKDGRDFVNLYQMGSTFRDHIAELYTHYGSITSRDAKVVKVRKADDTAAGAEMRVSFSYILSLEETERSYVKELQQLYLEVAAGMSAPQGSEQQLAAQARWLDGNAEIAGIPDIRDLLADKYVYALSQYGTTLEAELALAGVTPPAAQPQQESVTVQPPAATASVGVAPGSEEMARLTAELIAMGIPIPPGADLTGLQSLHSLYVKDTPAQPAVPTDAAAATPPAAAATTPPPAATTPAADMAATSDEDERLKEILDDRGIEWPDDADHEVLVYLVESSAPQPAQPAPAAQAGAVSVPPVPVTADGEPNFRALKTPVLREWLDAMYANTEDPVQKARFKREEGAGRNELLKLAAQAAIPF